MAGPLVVGAVVLVAALVGTLVVAVRRENVAAVVNAVVALVVSLLPTFLSVALAPAPEFGPAMTVWIAGAGFLHSLGMLGLYESTWWWDHLTHTVSAAFVAALVYAGVTIAARESASVALSATGVGVLTVGFTLFAGVFWELGELVAREVGDRFDVEPVLVHYGWRDTILDLVFDVVGALLVVGLDVRLFLPVARQFPAATRVLVLGGGGVVVIGSVLMLLIVTVLDRDWK